MANLVGQRQLRHLRRNAAVVVHEGDDTRVQGTFGALVEAGHRFRVGLVLFADAPGSTGCRCDPGQSQGATGEISVGTTGKNKRLSMKVNKCVH